MALQVTAYLCKYRCGKLSVNKDRIETHETRCLKNPDRRACITCKHNCRSPQGDEEPAYWYCFLGIEPVDGFKIVIDCSEWKQKG